MMPVLVGAAATCGLVGIVSYALFARAHTKHDEAAEAFYLRVHYISLFLLFAIGVIIMFYLGEYSD
ncbi:MULTISPECIES: hypothetical protein [Chitinophagaceae]|uniref:hypothetical protein n=1 Tax=Chitinophagaceae TaxID=563835 RepID=UPI000DEF7A69|nr:MULTISPECIES: hypothetical protein [Chitinophagaceae]RPD48796.1 hypothetical protein DRJ53_09015 [Paracnuella aquatica]